MAVTEPGKPGKTPLPWAPRLRGWGRKGSASTIVSEEPKDPPLAETLNSSTAPDEDAGSGVWIETDETGAGQGA